MKYFHCPETFRSKPYGCGMGPVNATTAFLDMGSKCPCGQELKAWTKPTKEIHEAERQQGIDTVRALFGDEAAERYAITKK